MSGAVRRVALAASGAGWETTAVRELEAASATRLVRRCVDVAELIALCQAGGVDVAALDLSLPSLDLEAVRAVQAAGVVAVGLGDPARAAALGITVVGAADDVVGAVSAVPVRAEDGTDRPAPGEATAPSTGRLVVVWGPAGAPGRSTVALALADHLAAEGRRCVLVDADTYGGAQAQQLGLLDEVSGLMAACRAANQGRLDEVADQLQVVRAGFAVLTGLPRADMWVHVRRAALERVVERLLAEHELVVADVGFCLEPGDGVAGAGRNQATAALLELADVVVVVGRADPVGLVRLVRGLADLADLGVDDPVVALNQVRPGIGWSDDELVATLGRLAGLAPSALLPADPATLDTAALRGVTPREVQASGPFASAVARLARALPVPARADVVVPTS